MVSPWTRSGARRWLPVAALAALAGAMLLIPRPERREERSDARPGPERAAAEPSVAGAGESLERPPAGSPAGEPSPEAPEAPVQAGAEQPGAAPAPAQGLELRGEVVKLDGAPVAGARVRLVLLGDGGPRGAAAAADGSGAFAARGLTPGRWKVSAWKRGFGRASVEVDVPAPEPVRIVLEEDPGFDVLVTDGDGSLIAGVHVRLLARREGIAGARSSAHTGADGRAHLEGLPEGADTAFRLEARHADFPAKRESFTARDIEGGTLRLVLEKGVEVSGRVVDAGGAAAPGAEVTLLRDGEPAAEPLKTTAGGEFRFKGAAPGAYDVLARTAERGAGEVRGVEARRGDGAAGLEVRLAEGPLSVSGRVVDRGGRGVALCPVSLTLPGAGADGSGAGPRLRTVSAEDGSFRFRGLESPREGAAAWELSAGGGKISRVARTVRPGEEEIVLTVGALGSIAGRIAAASPLGSYTLQLTRENAGGGPAPARAYRFTSSDSSFRLERIEPGTYRLALVAGGTERASVEDLEVLPGEETGPVELRVD
ncbi:MAG: carboxypeptidase regulatory-like domain-containing protein [Planctomycetes bacterium]|nr:carboxypeptidase regulatory-like domain-containing protein [Planctomycetota bacterium]